MKPIQLPRPVSQCDESPRVEMINGDVILKYENSEYEEQIVINFKDVYGFKYTETEYIDTLEYIFGCVEIENSLWIESFLNAWELRERSRDDAFGGEPSKIIHYRLCFDEYGMYDILCKHMESEKS
ncbi:hypothetical protein [Fusibacter sp. 3D3]|uniref:hypothetical protein n=1 Tax=Fusibacter sp. 3D3 TaxID=1048380 RepID=UPI0008534155|nr:hypothetical protein [Fusibacter sp. 3D3]GAU75494.1 hypothetical protein F3D3_0085 [Fusibacter sp. 3D3]